MRYGDEGDLFYLILQGSVSVWVPVAPELMKEPLKKFQEMLKSEKESKNVYRRPTKLAFKFKDFLRKDEAREAEIKK